MPDCCIAFIADNKYMFPTFVSAIQARRRSSATLADVFIFCIDLDEQTEANFAAACARENIHLRSVASSLILDSTAMLARLFMARFEPEAYTEFLNLDGAVHINSSLDPLILMSPPAGHFLASIDVMSFVMRGTARFGGRLTAYFESLGFSSKQITSYFNSGVLRMPREGWDAIGQAAWQFYLDHKSSSRFPDQDALNMVAGDRRMAMSLAWNFPVFLRNARLHGHCAANVVHFISQPKPWFGAFQPWDFNAYQVYLSPLWPLTRTMPGSLTPRSWPVQCSGR